MIIFNLEGTLTNDNHRRHYIDYKKTDMSIPRFNWIPDYQKYSSEFYKDKPNIPVFFQFYAMCKMFGIDHPIQIWTSRLETLRHETEEWIKKILQEMFMLLLS